MVQQEKDLSIEILSDVAIHMKYARYLEDKGRREIWEEIIDRNKEMHLRKFPELKEEIDQAYQFVYNKKIVPSMRSLQFAGKPIEINPARLYNCTAVAIDHMDVFSEIMFLLLSGCGVGYSVQFHHISKLPFIKTPIKPINNRQRKKRYLIPDSIEGWSESIKVLMESYFKGTKEIEFDFRDIRAKGERLITSGGKAPGAQPLKDCIHNIQKVLDNALSERGENTKLKSIEIHDIVCYISDAVLSGGIRRSACISLFNYNDQDMLECKFGDWYEKNPQRARSNNSVVLIRHKIKEEDFFSLWEKIKASNTGEPGIFFSNDKNYLCNPCAEVSLKSQSVCNLSSVNVSNIIDQNDFNERCKAAAFISTIQASYTDFHYLRESWREQIEKENLIGVSLTGVANNFFLNNIDIAEGAEIVVNENKRVSKLIDIDSSYRCTTLKPEGTSSLVMGTSSGIHAWFAPYYIRRIRVGKDETMYQYLMLNHPEILENDFFKPDKQAIISIPVKAPDNSIFRNESAIEVLERIKKINIEWIRKGHNKGSNYNNVSATIFVKSDEWDIVGKWMWENKEYYNGLTVLPYDGGNYIQAPLEEISKEKYEELYQKLSKVDFRNIPEYDSSKIDHKQIQACSGSNCEVF